MAQVPHRHHPQSRHGLHWLLLRWRRDEGEGGGSAAAPDLGFPCVAREGDVGGSGFSCVPTSVYFCAQVKIRMRILHEKVDNIETKEMKFKFDSSLRQCDLAISI